MKAVSYVLSAAVCWGVIGLFSRRLSEAGLSAGNIVFLRNGGGMLLLLLWFALRDRRVFRIHARDLWIFFGTGVVSVLFFTICYFRTQELCSLAVSAILLYAAPAIVVLLSLLLWKERLTGRKIAALLLAFAGCVFVSGLGSGALAITPMGFLFGIGSAFFYALYSIFSHYGLQRYAPFTVVVWTFCFAGLGSLFFLRPAELSLAMQGEGVALSALGLMLVATVAPYLLYTKGLEQLEPSKASILASLEPVAAALVGILAFGEPMSVSVLLGLGCILGCVFILK